LIFGFFFFSSRRRHTRFSRDWSSDVCSSDLFEAGIIGFRHGAHLRHFFLRRRTIAGGLIHDGLQIGLQLVNLVGLGRGNGRKIRSEERRVGKEGETRGGGEDWKKRRRG